jgi:hypothetical protein
VAGSAAGLELKDLVSADQSGTQDPAIKAYETAKDVARKRATSEAQARLREKAVDSFRGQLRRVDVLLQTADDSKLPDVLNEVQSVLAAGVMVFTVQPPNGKTNGVPVSGGSQ